MLHTYSVLSCHALSENFFEEFPCYIIILRLHGILQENNFNENIYLENFFREGHKELLLDRGALEEDKIDYLEHFIILASFS